MSKFAIMRFEKIKNGANLTKVEKHHIEREKLKYRANPEFSKYNLTYSKKNANGKTLNQLFKKKVKQVQANSQKRIRKDAVLGAEFVCTFSPNAITDLEQLKKWTVENLKFFTKKFGAKNMQKAFFECDETTPHLHIFVTSEKDGRFSWKAFFPDKYAISEFQTEYAKAMEQFGLERGLQRTFRNKDQQEEFNFFNGSERPRHKSSYQFLQEQMAKANKIIEDLEPYQAQIKKIKQEKDRTEISR